jgi:hypothetical protein
MCAVLCARTAVFFLSMACIRAGGLRKHNDSPLRSQDAVAAQQLAADMITSDHQGGSTIEVLHTTRNATSYYYSMYTKYLVYMW